MNVFENSLVSYFLCFLNNQEIVKAKEVHIIFSYLTLLCQYVPQYLFYCFLSENQQNLLSVCE